MGMSGIGRVTYGRSVEVHAGRAWPTTCWQADQRKFVHLRETVCEAGHGHICTQPLQRGDRTFDGARQLSRHEADRRHSAEFLAPMSKIRDEIKQVYDSSGASEQMAAAKAATIDELRTRYRQMRDTLGRIPRIRRLVSMPRSTTRSSPRLPSKVIRFRRFSACSTCVPAAPPPSDRRQRSVAVASGPNLRRPPLWRGPAVSAPGLDQASSDRVEPALPVRKPAQGGRLRQPAPQPVM